MLPIDIIKSIACLSELHETEEEKYNFQYSFFTKIINKEVEKINQSLVQKGMIEKDILHIQEGMEGGLYLPSTWRSKLLKFDSTLSVIENIHLFYENKDKILKESLKIAQNIQLNKEKVKEMIYNLCLELRSEEGVFSKPNSLDFSLTSYYTHKDGYYYLRIFHNEKQLCTENIYLYVKVYDESNMEKMKISIKNMIKNAWKAKEQKRKDEKAKELRFFANNIGEEYNQRFNFKVVESLPQGKMYDIDQQNIHVDFDLENEQLKEEFEREALLPIFTIFEYENMEEIHGKLDDIRVSKRYFYLFKEEKIIENDCYQFYECKGTHNKKLLKVFKNGKQLKGRSRTKTLKQLGHGR